MIDAKPQNRLFENLQNLLPQLLAWVFNLLWLAKIFWQQHEFILPDTGLDGYLIAIIFAAGIYFRRYSGFLPAFCLLSYEVHAQAALQIENLQTLYILSWLACTLMVYRQPDRGCSLTLYHAALSFDPGSATTAGVGMQIGFSAVPVTIMFIAVFARELWNNRFGFDADSRHFAAIFALAWLAVNHHQGGGADLTAQFIAFAAASVLFYTTFSMASNERERVRQVLAIAAGGVMVILVAFLNQALEAGNLAEFFSRRAYAGGLHPNHIACWCLAAIWALIAGSRDFAKFYQRRLRFFILLFLAMIVMTGARLIIAIAFGGLMLHFFLLRRKDTYASSQEKPLEVNVGGNSPAKHRILVAAAVIIIALVGVRVFYHFDYFDLAGNERFYIWKAAMNLIQQAPWTGHGVLQFAMLPQQIDSAAATWVYDWNYPHTHQGLLELLLWGGIPLLIAFAWAWYKALLVWNAAGLLIGFLSVSATIVADFTWRTPAMVVMAIFFLLLPARPAVKSEKVSNLLKICVLLPLVVVVVWLLQIHTGHLSYNRAISALGKGQGTWKTEINRAVSLLPFSSDIQMQRLLWKLSRESIDDEFSAQLESFRKSFPDFWPAIFIEARYNELKGDASAALNLYAQTLALEPVDLSGIRNARAALLAQELNDPRFTDFLGNALARGEWGPAILLNHPKKADYFKQQAKAFAESFEPSDFFAAVKLAKILKNMAQNNVLGSSISWQRLKKFKLPDWLIDEALAARYQAEFKAGLSINIPDSVCDELQKHGSACWRTLAWIRLQQGDHEGFAGAYQQMLGKFNFRNKNYEELAGQFLFAQDAIQRKAYPEAIDMLQKLTMFDSSNPFISELMAQSFKATGDREKTEGYVSLARAQAQNARFEPFYREEPRNNLWPQGDQWVFLFEKVFRRHDKLASKYCETNWNSFLARL